MGEKKHPRIVDIVEVMNNKIQERLGAQTIEYNGIYVSVDKITLKNTVHLHENQTGSIIQDSGLNHVFVSFLEQNQTGVIIKRKGPHYPQYSYDIIIIHSLMMYSDITEYK